MSQRITIVTSAVAVAAAIAAVTAAVETCDIRIQDQPDAAVDAAIISDAIVNDALLTDSAAPSASADASVVESRWGSLVRTCNLMGTCEASIACENSSRYHFRCKISGRSGLPLPPASTATPMDGGKAPPVVILQYPQYGSLSKECDEAATCADSIQCENRLRSTYACQTTRAAP